MATDEDLIKDQVTEHMFKFFASDVVSTQGLGEKKDTTTEHIQRKSVMADDKTAPNTRQAHLIPHKSNNTKQRLKKIFLSNQK